MPPEAERQAPDGPQPAPRSAQRDERSVPKAVAAPPEAVLQAGAGAAQHEVVAAVVVVGPAVRRQA